MDKISFTVRHAVNTMVLLVLPLLIIAQPAIHLIPKPKELKILEGNFTIGAGTTIFIENSAYSETAFAASELAAEIKGEIGFLPRISAKQSVKSIVLCK